MKDNIYNKNSYLINNNEKYIEWYISYNIFQKFVKGFYLTQPNCDIGINAPLTIHNAFTSNINYNDMFDYIKDEFYNSHCTKYDKLLKVSICKEKNNTLYSYGTYFNDKEQKLFNFPIKVSLNNCDDSKYSHVFEHCQDFSMNECCENKNNKLKEHQHMFPSQYNFRYYSHNHKFKPHNKNSQYIFPNTNHTLPFSIFPRINKDNRSIIIKPNGNKKYLIQKEDN